MLENHALPGVPASPRSAIVEDPQHVTVLGKKLVLKRSHSPGIRYHLHFGTAVNLYDNRILFVRIKIWGNNHARVKFHPAGRRERDKFGPTKIVIAQVIGRIVEQSHLFTIRFVEASHGRRLEIGKRVDIKAAVWRKMENVSAGQLGNPFEAGAIETDAINLPLTRVCLG